MKQTLQAMLIALVALMMPIGAWAQEDNVNNYIAVDTEAGTLTIDGTLGGKATATEEDVNTLVTQLKEYVGSGITTIVILGSKHAMYASVMGTIPAYAEALYLLADGNYQSPYCGTIDLILPDATEIVDHAFDNAFALKSITLPKVITVGDGAFYACHYLQTITFGSVVTAISQNKRVVFHNVGKEVGGCDLVLNCGQAGENSPYIPDFTANTWYDTYNKFKSITLTHDDSEHTTTTDKGDGTHEFTCTICGDIATEAHSGGTATCTHPAECEHCGAAYGDVAPDNHVSEHIIVTDNGDGTHDATCTVCGAVVDKNKPHTIEDHVCTACGAMEITVNFDAGDYEWKTGDQMCLLREAEQLDDCVFTATVAEDGTVTWTADKPFCWYGEGGQKLFAAPNNGWSIDYFVIPDDQSTAAKLDKADLINAMWAGNPTTDTITFNMRHRMAKVTVNYEFAEGVAADISELKVYSIARIFRFSVDDWSIITSAGQYDVWVTPYLDGNQFTAFISPETYATGEDFIKISLSDGTVYDVKMNEDVTFAEGEEYTYKVIITADSAYLTCANGCTNFTYTDNGDGTHKKVCTECGTEVVEEHGYTLTAESNMLTEVCVCDHTNGTITLEAEDKTYDGKAVEVVIARTGSLENADITIAYTKDGESFTGDPIEAGSYTATVTLEEKSVSVEFTIVQANVEAAEIVLEYDETVCDGTEKTPAVTAVVVDGVTIDPASYDVTYADNTAVGTATVNVPSRVTTRGR